MADRVSAEFDGIAFEADADAMADFDFLEHLYSLNEAGGLENAIPHIIPLAHMMFGAEQWAGIKAALRERESEEPHCARCIAFIFGALDAAAAARRGEVKN